MRYGFVGLGQLGARLAINLLRGGFAVLVTDLDRDNAAEVIAQGGVWHDSAQALAAEVDALVTCLPSPTASASVAESVLPIMRPGSTLIEMSTTSVEAIKQLAAFATTHDIAVLECPCTGGVHRAAIGEMTVFIGGDAAVLEQHLPAFEAMCGPRFHVGEIGSASLLKIISNLLCLIDLVAAGEALMLAKKGGLDLGTCYDAICASSGASREFEDWIPVVLNGSLNTGFTLELALKDLGFATELADAYDVPLPTTSLIKSLFEQARGEYGGQAWTPHVLKMLEEQAGVELRAAGFGEVIKPLGTEQ